MTSCKSFDYLVNLVDILPTVILRWEFLSLQRVTHHGLSSVTWPPRKYLLNPAIACTPILLGLHRSYADSFSIMISNSLMHGAQEHALAYNYYCKIQKDKADVVAQTRYEFNM